MATEKLRVRAADAWELTRRQHGVITRSQLADLGMSAEAIRHRLACGRLHRIMPGIYAVGRPDISERGRWMAAVLACGPDALLSHRSGAALLGIRRASPGPVEVVVPAHVRRCRPGIRVYRRVEPEWNGESGTGPARGSGGDTALPYRWIWKDIPVTGPAVVLVDLATRLGDGPLEAAVNEADHRDLVDPETLRGEIASMPRRPGARRLGLLLDAASCALTATQLERYFLPIALGLGLPRPETQAQLGSHRVDFYWAELGLVVETDSLRYHRTPFKQAADKRRDNAHARSGLVTLRFTHGHVRHEPDYVRAELRAVIRKLTRTAA
jgi:predicted transcriptional regulator of viral defense system